MPLPAATNSIYTIPDVQLTHQGAYDVVVTNVAGSATSSVAVLTVNVRPGIARQPESLARLAGGEATFSVLATGTAPLSYQWRFNGTALVGATGSALQIQPVANANAGAYDVIITNSFGSITSAVALLNLGVPPAILTHPRSQIVNVGSNVTLQVVATGSPPPTIQWRRNGIELPGQTNAVLLLPAVSAVHEGTYEAAANAAGNTVFTAGAVLTVRRFFGPGLAIGWGDNRYNLDSSSAVQSPVVGLACGSDFNLFLHASGVVSSYGGLDAARYAPPAWLSNVTAISAGTHRMALRADGVVVVWGPFYEYYGLNGAPPGLSGVVAIAAGLYHCLALKRDGSVVAWNGNYDRFGETYVPEALNAVVAIAAGAYHSVAVKVDGTVLAWGRNDVGQCNVPAGLTEVVAVAAGFSQTLALRRDGSVVAWGANERFGVNLGLATVPFGLSNVVAIAASSEANAALKSDGTVVGWGSNPNGFLDTLASQRGVASLAFSRGDWVVLQGRPVARTDATRLISALGEAASLTGSADGVGPFRFQWQFNGVDILGATNATLFLPALTSTSLGFYRFLVANAAGTSTSESIEVVLRRSLSALSRPAAGQPFRFRFATDGHPVYQVDVSTNLTSWQPLGLLSNTNAEVEFEDTTAGSGARRYFRVVTP